MKSNIKEYSHDCDCDHPNIRDSFKDGKCSKEQIIQCHGHEAWNKIKKEGL